MNTSKWKHKCNYIFSTYICVFIYKYKEALLDIEIQTQILKILGFLFGEILLGCLSI